MTGDERELVKSQERVEKGAAGITAEYRKLAKESLETQRFAKRAWEESGGAAQVYQEKLGRLKAEYAANSISAEQYRAGVAKLEAQHQSMVGVATKGLSAIGTELMGLAGGLTSIGGSIQTIVSGINTWVENTREIAMTTRDAMKEVVAFAVMQTPGEARALAIEVAERYAGVMTQGESWDTFQAMQSATGTRQGAFKATDWVVEAMRLQVAKEDALETARQAVVQKQDVGDYLRAVAASGEFGIRDAPTMAKASRALKDWQDKIFGWAAAATVGGAFGEQVEPYTRQAGVALSGVSKAREWFEARGLGMEATQQQRLTALVEESKNTVEELAEIGLVDAEARGAVQTLVANFDTVMKDYKQLGDAVRDPSFMRARRAQAEAGIPEVGLAAAIAQQEGRFTTARSFDQSALRFQLREKMWATELAKRGIREGFLGWDLYDATGNINPWAFYATRVANFTNPSAPFSAAWSEAGKSVQQQMQQTLDGIQKNTVPLLPRPRVPTPEQ